MGIVFTVDLHDILVTNSNTRNGLWYKHISPLCLCAASDVVLLVNLASYKCCVAVYKGSSEAVPAIQEVSSVLC